MKPRTSSEAPPLSAGVVAVLLAGWGAGKDEPDDAGLFELFQENTPGVVQLWRRHEAFLRAEARRLGIAPSWTVNGRAAFFGSSCAAPAAARWGVTV